MGNCKNCRFWDMGVCDVAEMAEDDKERPAEDGMVMLVKSADDWQLSAKLRTGAMFGCVKYSPQEKRQQ